MKCDLVLEGGGVKGIALVGAVDALQEHGYEVQRVAGTSAGSIVGALVAAGMPADARRELMCGVDYSRFQDGTLLDRFVLGKAWSLLRTQGVYSGRYLKEWLGEQLDGCGVRVFGDLAMPADAEAPPEAGGPGLRSRLLVMASDVTYGRLRRLPDDYSDMGCPDPASVPVVDAVRASMAIPFFYEPARMPGRDGRPVVLVDGGMLSNFPVAVFDRRDGQPPRWPTFGVKLSARAGSQAARFRTDGRLTSLTKALVGTMTSFYDQMHLSDPAVLARTVFVDTFGVKATDFDLDEATRDRLYENGRTAMEQFLATWDFERYVAEHRRPAVPAQGRPEEAHGEDGARPPTAARGSAVP